MRLTLQTQKLRRQKINDRIGSYDIDFFKKVKDGYLELAEKFEDDFLVLDATQDFEFNTKIIYEWLDVD